LFYFKKRFFLLKKREEEEPIIREEEEEVRIRKETEKLLTIIEEAKSPKRGLNLLFTSPF